MWSCKECGETFGASYGRSSMYDIALQHTAQRHPNMTLRDFMAAVEVRGDNRDDVESEIVEKGGAASPVAAQGSPPPSTGNSQCTDRPSSVFVCTE